MRKLVALSDLHQHVRTAIEAGDLQRPRQICEAILAARPDNLETILLLAEIELESGHQHAAIDGFDRVLQSDPECFLAYAGLGIAFEALHDTTAAAHWFSRAFDLNPLNLEVRAQRDRLLGEAYPGRSLPRDLSDIATARSLLDAGLAEQALSPFRRALAHEPGRHEARVGLAEALWTLGLHGETIAACRLALIDVPHAVKIHALLASIAADEGDLDHARAILADVHAQDPDGRIGARFLFNTPVSDSAIEPVDLSIDPKRLSVRDAGDIAVEIPQWVGWMRRGLWQMLRLLLVPGEADDSAPATQIELPVAHLQQRAPPPPVRTSGPLGKRIQASRERMTQEQPVSEETVQAPIVEPERPRRRTPPPTSPQPPAPGASDDAQTEPVDLAPHP